MFRISNVLPGPSRKEQQGTFVLVALACVFVFVAPHVPKWFAGEPEDHADRLAQVEAEWLALCAAEQHTPAGVPQAKKKLFAFNPNGLPIAQWMELGLSLKQAQSVHKFEAAGGRFRSPSDVSRLFVVSDRLFAEWRPFIRIPERVGKDAENRAEAKPFRDSTQTKQPPPVQRVDLNQADTTELTSIRGIGAYTARQIVRLRERLGGFRSLDQLADVMGMRENNLQRILPHLRLGELLALRDMNRADVKTLGNHPFLSWNQAKAIVNYREQHGAFGSWEDVLNIHLVAPQDTLRLRDYFHL